MQCKRVNVPLDRLLDPLSAEWQGVPGEVIAMTATPLANQPSEYIKATRNEAQIGRVRSLMVQAAHNGSEIFFRLSWEDVTENLEVTDSNEFVDGCGVLMPLAGGEPPIEEMGSPKAPVNAWLWRANLHDEPRNTTARGLGTTQFSEQCAIRAQSAWGLGAWAVVFARPLAVPAQQAETTQLAAGGTVKVGFAVWEGSNAERGGVKSFSKEWRELHLES